MSCSVSAAAIETLNHWLTKVFKSAELASPEQIVRIINNMIGENRGAVRWQDPWCDHRYLYDRMVTVQYTTRGWDWYDSLLVIRR